MGAALGAEESGSPETAAWRPRSCPRRPVRGPGPAPTWPSLPFRTGSLSGSCVSRTVSGAVNEKPAPPVVADPTLGPQSVERI